MVLHAATDSRKSKKVEHPVFCHVSTPYGDGDVISYRPSDEMYQIKLAVRYCVLLAKQLVATIRILRC